MINNNISYENIFPRTPVHDIDELAEYLYKNVLLICESSGIDDLIGVRIDSKLFNNPLKSKVKFIYNNTQKINKAQKSCKRILPNTISVNELDNKIYFVPKRNKIISLLKHIRNAFAHNLVVLDEDHIILGDFLSNKNGLIFSQPTMLGRISKENLKLLVTTIGKLRNDQKVK